MWTQPATESETEMSDEQNPAPELSMEEMKERIAILEANLASSKATAERERERYSNIYDEKQKAERFITELVTNGELDGEDEVVTGLAEIFNWELTEEHSVTILVTFSGTITTPIGKSLEGLEDEIDAEISMSYDRRNDGYELDLNYGYEVEIS